MVTPTGIRVTIGIFILSLIAGVLSKQYGMALTSGLRMLENMESLLNSEPGQNLMSDMKIENAQLSNEIAEPFWWPLSAKLRKAMVNGKDDPLASDKQFISIFSKQLYTNFFHIFLGAAGLASVAFFLQ